MASHTEEGEAGQIEKTESLAEEGQEQRASSHPRIQKENVTYALEKKKYKIGHLNNENDMLLKNKQNS
jgi:hypothetical protein